MPLPRAAGRATASSPEDVTDRDPAVATVGRDIGIVRELLPPNEPGEYYWHDLVGLQVANREGAELGRVVQLLDTGANDVLVVEGDRKRLIPYVRGVYVDEVDLDDGRILVDWHVDD